MKKLVIAEKPSAARDYADVLNCNNKKNGYIEGEDYIVTWSIGHLLTLYEPEDYDSKYKEWKFEDLPIIPDIFKIKILKKTKKQYNIIKSLVKRKDVSEIINGGDAGREGELIQRYILNSICTNKPIKRLWVSSLTPAAIKKGFDNLKDSCEYDSLYMSAKTRAEIDWLIGMNYSRAYTTLNKGNKAIVVGRVQTVILNLVYKREMENKNFNPLPYKEIEAEFENYTGKYLNGENYRIFDFNLADKVYNDCKNSKGIIKSIENEEKKKYAPELFNLTGLQKIMNKKYNFSSQKTLDIAQRLYEKYKILSYPRTDSKFLSDSHKTEIPQIITSLDFGEFSSYLSSLDIDRLKFSKRFINDDKITDHHAIIPSLNINISSIYNKLSSDEKFLFNEVVKRFISQFYNPYIYESTKLITKVKDKYLFKSKGKVIIEEGWKEIYPDKNTKDIGLPDDLKEGLIKNVTNIDIIDKETKPPSLYDESDLLSQLEKYNIGTESTRAGIIEKLLSRKHIYKDKKKLFATASGKEILNVIISNDLKSPELTGELETKLEDIRLGKIDSNNLLNREINKLKDNLSKLLDVSISVNKDKPKGIVKCPKCKTGSIVKHKNFYGCTNWNTENVKCSFSINKIAGKLLTENQVKFLCTKGYTNKLRGFLSKSGNKFAASLKLGDDFNISFDFDNKFRSSSVLNNLDCPVCDTGKIVDKGSFYGCSAYKSSSCSFSVSKNILGKKISPSILKSLCDNGSTDKISGFVSKNKKKFSASLKLNNGKVEFDF